MSLHIISPISKFRPQLGNESVPRREGGLLIEHNILGASVVLDVDLVLCDHILHGGDDEIFASDLAALGDLGDLQAQEFSAKIENGSFYGW